MREPKAFPWKTAEEAVAYRQQFRTLDDPISAKEEIQAARKFDEQLYWLPETDVELATAIYTAMATSDLEELRHAIAFSMDMLYVADKETASPLWKDLLEEESPDVHEIALESLKGAVEAGYISEGDAAPLIRAYEEARARASQTPDS